MTTSISPAAQFITTTLTAAGGFALGIGIGDPRRSGDPERAPVGRRGRALSRRDQRLGRDRARRHRDHPLWPRRDGAGQLHRAAADPRRGARMRLGLGEARICLGQPQSPGQQGLRQPGHRRQPRGARDRRDRPAGRRQRARAPDRGGGEALERAGVRMRGGDEQGHAQADRPHVPLWRARGRGGRDQARQGAGDQDARISTSSSAGGSRGSTCRSRSTARRNTASISKCPAWCTPRSSPARCSAAR